MSYHDEEQAIEPHINTILKGIEGFNEATRQRIKSGNWQDTHIRELNELRRRFLDIEVELNRLKKETW